MKKARKLITFILTVVMVLSMSMTAMAEDLTIDGTSEGKKYDLYKVLDLSQSGNAYSYTVNSTFEPFFTDVKGWEDPISEIGKLDSNSEDLSELAKEILIWADMNNIKPIRTVDGEKDSTIVNDLEYGYYLLNPLGAQGVDAEANYATMFSLSTVDGEDPSITVKAVYPTITKQVNGEDGPIEAVIGETVTFTLNSIVPDMTGYNRYYYIVTDTMSEGLEYQGITSITIGNGENVITLSSENYDLKESTSNSDGSTTLEIVFKDFIDYIDESGQPIVITYTAIVGENAEINAANTNDVQLTYSNDPKYTYDGNEPSEDEDDDNDDSTQPPTGETPKDIVEVYTTELTINKVDGSKNPMEPLSGAKFRITGESWKVDVKTNEVFVEDADGEYWALKSGTYTTEAPNEGGVDSDNYEDIAKKYRKEIDQDIENTSSENIYKEGEVDQNGILTFSGLGAGTYTISEIVTPDGYNSIPPFTVTISFDSGTKEFSYKEGTSETSTNTDTPIEVVNNTGSELPSTGGIGTTIFYIVGGALVLFAVVLLVTKKRMKDTQ